MIPFHPKLHRPGRSIARLLAGIAPSQQRAALVELCERGLITCTRGRPGEPDATYALAWLPLDDAERYPFDIRERHAANMLRLQRSEGRA